MKAKQQKGRGISRRERSALIAIFIVMGTFVLFVCIATSMSLAYYMTPHVVLTLAVVGTLFFGTRHKSLVRIMMVLGVTGALAAILLLAAYQPYYTQHINYMNSLK